MDRLSLPRCSICGKYKKDAEAWFLITESLRDDKLIIWRWNLSMAGPPPMHPVCSPRHVRELVVHWMTTGCLDYPFASADQIRPLAPPASSLCQANHDAQLAPYQVGEIAVHRESITRALQENPVSLNVILDELMYALDDRNNESKPEFDDDSYILFA